MKSSNLISKQAQRKGNPELVETIMLAKKNEAWRRVGEILAYPKRKGVRVNLDLIDKESKEGDTIVVPGKVLGDGNISKRLAVVAFSFSEEARKKLKESKCDVVELKIEIKKNPKAQGVKVLK